MSSSQDYENADTISIDTLALEETMQEERAREVSGLNILSSKVCNLHTSVLYHRNPQSKLGEACYNTWTLLMKKIGGITNGWRDLGYALGISQDEMDYIRNSVKDDQANIVLKVFMQDENATLDKVLNAFVKMDRYDVIKSIEDSLSELAQHFGDEDSGYLSSTASGPSDIISFTKDLPNDLPPALNKSCVDDEKDKPKLPEETFKTITTRRTFKKDTPILFLTFTEDGSQTAQNIKNYISKWTDIKNTIVITLEDRKEEVYPSPENFIRECFETADYIVPIITPEYLRQITIHRGAVPRDNDNLDYKYVSFIYTLIVNYYIHGTGCYNKKVRSILPKDFDKSVLNKIYLYPDLMPFTSENNFNEQFREFFKQDNFIF